MRSRAESRARDLEAVLLEAGLRGQVSVGVPRPISDPVPGMDPAPQLLREAPVPGTGERAPETESEDGLSELDARLRPLLRPALGQLLEISGDLSSGRTALAYRMALGTTARGELVAWVDLPNALDPRFLQRAGVALESLLWVRPPELRAALRASELLLKAGFATVVTDLSGVPADALSRLGAGVWTRLLRAVRQSRATAILLGAGRAAGSFATLALHTERRRSRFEYGLFEGLDVRASVVRDRAGPAGAAYPVQVSHRPPPRPR